MKKLIQVFATFGLAVTLLTGAAHAEQPKAAAAVQEINKVCPISGKPADPAVTVVYESVTYAFATDADRTKFNDARAASLYQRLGGKASLDAVVDAFYVKVLADKRINQHFKDINMNKQRRKQKEFLSAAFGGPVAWTGLDMRKAHADLKITEAQFNAVAENLKSTLEDFKVKPELITEVMTIAGSVREAVLNKKPQTK